MYFDTHAHLDQADFDEDRDLVIKRARDAKVSSIICVGTTAENSEFCVQLASQYDGVYASVGIHPNHCAEAAADDWQRIVSLAEQPAVVAIGETGLDRYWDYAPLDLQQDYFARHIRLAHELKKPFVVHMRECEQDILTALNDAHREYGKLHGVMHSFTGDQTMAEACLQMGMYISFAGMVTFKKSNDLRQVAATIPPDKILVETDSPYLSPHPLRGKRNEPARVIHTADCIALVRDQSNEAFAQLTTANAMKFFGLDEG